MKTITTLAVCAFSMATANSTLRADTFGTAGNQFTIDFANIGNPGNADDAGAGGGLYSTPFGGVAYGFRMAVTEAPQDWIDKATNLGLTNVTAGIWTGMQPANLSWFEAAAFVNWLNTSTGHHTAYDLSWTGSTWTMSLWLGSEAWQAGGENLYRHKDAYYFLPSEDEWYKAAYHKNDGVTANYWDYPTASNSAPDGIDFSADPNYQAVLFDGYNQGGPNAVTSAGSSASAYGTFGQGGNIHEWTESATDGSNNNPDEGRAIRGGGWNDSEDGLRSSIRFDDDPPSVFIYDGFRVASVPEPTAAMLLLTSGVLLVLRRQRQTPNDRNG